MGPAAGNLPFSLLETGNGKPKTDSPNPLGPKFFLKKFGAYSPDLELCSREETEGFSEANLRPNNFFLLDSVGAKHPFFHVFFDWNLEYPLKHHVH